MTIGGRVAEKTSKCMYTTRYIFISVEKNLQTKLGSSKQPKVKADMRQNGSSHFSEIDFTPLTSHYCSPVSYFDRDSHRKMREVRGSRLFLQNMSDKEYLVLYLLAQTTREQRPEVAKYILSSEIARRKSCINITQSTEN